MQGNSLKDNLEQAAGQQASLNQLMKVEQDLSLPDSFKQVLPSVGESSNLPKRMDLKGNIHNLPFEEGKANNPTDDVSTLCLMDQSELTGHTGISGKLNIDDVFSNKDVSRLTSAFVRPKNLLMRLRNMPYERLGDDSMQEFRYHEVSQFQRMKTVFGHCLIDQEVLAPIYNVMYDKTGDFIISGAEDCIIKIWDRHSMNLQASLHSHEDVITDIDVSKCNRYLASASKDGRIIIWDWQNCKKLNVINDHHARANIIKFFSLYTKVSSDDSSNPKEEIKILVSCSQDGTVRIYDEITYLESLANQELPSNQDQIRNSPQIPGGSGQQQLHQRERFCLALKSSDITNCPPNISINNVHINKNGIVAAGADKGYILIWEIDLKAFAKSLTSRKYKAQTSVTFQDSFKMFRKDVQHIEFSPNGESLFAGSKDGTANIWMIEKGKKISLSEENQLTTFKIQRKHSGQDNTLYQSEWNCDQISWSVNGRYAITAISVQNGERSYCYINVWDSFNEQMIQDIGKGESANLSSPTNVLSAHPKMEEIFMSSHKFGNICIWNIKTRKLIKQFIDYDIYINPQEEISFPQSGRFSNDGSSFVIGSSTGTLSLFACDGSISNYSATRVEQFFSMDDAKHPNNIYYEIEDGREPQLCGKNLIAYECQPSSPLIGKFRNSRLYTTEEYERNLMLRQHLSKQEEEFIMDRLTEALESRERMREAPIINPHEESEYSLSERINDETYEQNESMQSVEDDDNAILELEEEPLLVFGARQRRVSGGGRFNTVFEAIDHNGIITRSTYRYQEESKVQLQSQRLRIRAPNTSKPSDQTSSDEQTDDAYDISDIQLGSNTRGRKANRSESRKRTPQLRKNDDESAGNMMSLDDFEGKQYQSSQTSEDEEKKMASEYEEEKVSSKNKRRGRAILDESQDEEMEDDDASGDEEPLEMLKGDQDYDLLANSVQLEEDMIEQPKQCQFCRRSDGPIIGPFVKSKDPALAHAKLYFHQDCLEASNTTYYDKQKNKWMNIGKAIEKFQQKPCMCDRCGEIGATIKCSDCRKQYHGYYCSSLYMIQIAQREYQCFECRHKDNFKQFSKSPGMDKVDYDQIKRNLPREAFLSDKPTKDYLPQIGDEVYYFFQGHEKFISAFNRFFYDGAQEELPIEVMYPWRKYIDLKSLSACKIIDVSCQFPSPKAMSLLMKKFQQNTKIHQFPQIIQRLTLQILADPSSVFEVVFFPSMLPDFIVLKDFYDAQYDEFVRQCNRNGFVDKVFEKRGGSKYRILGIKNYEDFVNPGTNWQSILCLVEEQHCLGGIETYSIGSRDENDQEQKGPQLANFWDFKLAGLLQMTPRPLDKKICRLIMDALQDYINKNGELCEPFMERVTEKLADDYRDHIPGEMFLILISNRVVNRYYRSVHQIFADLNQIHMNSINYNGENKLTLKAKEMVEGINDSIKKALSSCSALNGSYYKDSRTHDKAKNKITIDQSFGGIQGPDNPLIKSKSLQKTTNQKPTVSKDINDNKYEVGMQPLKKMSDRQSNVTLPSIPTQQRKYKEEEKLVDPLIQQVISNRDDDSIPALSASKRRLTCKGNFKVGTKADNSTVNPPPLTRSMVKEEGLIGKRARSGCRKSFSHAKLKEDSESDFNDLDQDDDAEQIQPAVKRPKKRPRHG